jgi:flagellin-like protein
MNVFGKSERSWRKARKRGVSPIIATILLVAITVVLAAVLYVLITGLTHGPSSISLGTAYNPGGVIASQQPAANTGTGTCAAASTTLAAAVKPSEWVYTFAIESSSVTFGSVGFEVKSSAGAVLAWTAGGFYIVTSGGAIAACGLGSAANGFASVSGLTYPTANGITASTPLTTLFTIVIDTGTAGGSNPWTGLGNYFVTVGLGSYSGTVGGPTTTTLP